MSESGETDRTVSSPQSLDVPRLLAEYFDRKPDPADLEQQISFGTSGHRGTSSKGSFNEAHVIAITKAIVDYRRFRNYTGPLILGKDTHALSEVAQRTVIEVLAGNGVTVWIQSGSGYTPTPVVSRTILRTNRSNPEQLADGIILTPSHNPPEDGGLKYNPPHGGPANQNTTIWITNRAKALLSRGVDHVSRLPFERALQADTTVAKDFMMPYVAELDSIVDLKAIRASGMKIGVDPLGGSGLDYWEPIAERYGLDLTVVNPCRDPTFAFMPPDHDGKIRMDCSSPHAMKGLIKLKKRFDIAFGNDPDFDRHGIVTPEGLMKPNHFLSAAVHYLFTHRPDWNAGALVGKTIVSSSMIDCVVHSLERKILEMPVGFKWFVDGLYNGTCGFGGEESAGANFLCRDGTTWCTDKDGFVMDLLAAEILATTQKNPAIHYRDLEAAFGRFYYERLDAPANLAQREQLKNLSPKQVKVKELAGEAIRHKRTKAPGNGAAIGGLKLMTQNGWFAARPSGTEDIYKIYAESFLSPEHLLDIQHSAKSLVEDILID